jgi:hypothetical protein
VSLTDAALTQHNAGSCRAARSWACWWVEGTTPLTEFLIGNHTNSYNGGLTARCVCVCVCVWRVQHRRLRTRGTSQLARNHTAAAAALRPVGCETPGAGASPPNWVQCRCCCGFGCWPLGRDSALRRRSGQLLSSWGVCLRSLFTPACLASPHTASHCLMPPPPVPQVPQAVQPVVDGVPHAAAQGHAHARAPACGLQGGVCVCVWGGGSPLLAHGSLRPVAAGPEPMLPLVSSNTPN